MDDDKVSTVVDLGCGPGNVSPFLRGRFSNASLWCVDTSDAMLERAKADHAKDARFKSPPVSYVNADFESFKLDKKIDLIFSNAAFHWVSFDIHRRLLPNLLKQLSPGGTLAFQMPDTRQQASHMLMQEAAKQAGLGAKMDKVRWVTTEVDPEQYYDLLTPLCSSLDMWSTRYCQILEGENPVYEFTRASGFGPYLAAAGGADSVDGQKLIAKYKELLLKAYPKHNGKTLFNFNRFFLVAQVQAASHL
jgi:trans-aconitate methyltransferase